MLTWLKTVTSVKMKKSGLFVRMYSISAFITHFGLSHVHLVPAFFWNMVFMILYFLYVAQYTKVSSLSFLNPTPNLPVSVSTWFVIYPICALKSPITIV